MFYVGIDIGKPRHCAAAIDGQGQVVLKPIAVLQSRAGLEEFEKRLHTLGAMEEIKIALEASGHYWKILWQFLTQKGWHVDVLNPILSASTARTHMRGRKTDADDAIFIAKTLRDGGFSPLVIGSPEIEQIKTLCRQRRWTVGEMCNARRRLTAILDRVFPEFADHFSDPFGTSALAILKEAPSAKRVAALHLKRLTHLLCVHSRNQFGAAKARELREAARTSLAAAQHDEAMESCALLLIAQLEFFAAQATNLETQIASQFDGLNHPISTIPGIGRITAPLIVGELGDIARFSGPRGAHRILAYAGLDPRVRESGQWKGRAKMSKRGSPVLRTALYQAASMVRLHHPYFAAIYERHRHQKQKHHATAISHVARKLVEVIYAVCKSNQPFDPAKLCPSTT